MSQKKIKDLEREIKSLDSEKYEMARNQRSLDNFERLFLSQKVEVPISSIEQLKERLDENISSINRTIESKKKDLDVIKELLRVKKEKSLSKGFEYKKTGTVNFYGVDYGGRKLYLLAFIENKKALVYIAGGTCYLQRSVSEYSQSELVMFEIEETREHGGKMVLRTDSSNRMGKELKYSGNYKLGIKENIDTIRKFLGLKNVEQKDFVQGYTIIKEID